MDKEGVKQIKPARLERLKDKEALDRIADVAEISLLLAGAVLEELYKLGYRKLPEGEPPLPTPDEIKEWIAKTFSHLNPDIRDYFYLGIEALYTHLGGKKFIEVKMPDGQ